LLYRLTEHSYFEQKFTTEVEDQLFKKNDDSVILERVKWLQLETDKESIRRWAIEEFNKVWFDTSQSIITSLSQQQLKEGYKLPEPTRFQSTNKEHLAWISSYHTLVKEIFNGGMHPVEFDKVSQYTEIYWYIGDPQSQRQFQVYTAYSKSIESPIQYRVVILVNTILSN
jgi:hypothetical protein